MLAVAEPAGAEASLRDGDSSWQFSGPAGRLGGMCWPAERETGLLLSRAGPAVAAAAVCWLGEAASAGTTGTAVKLAAAAVGGSGGGTAAGEGPCLLA